MNDNLALYSCLAAMPSDLDGSPVREQRKKSRLIAASVINPAKVVNGEMIVHTFTHGDKASFLAKGIDIVNSEEDPSKVADKHNQLIARTMKEIGGHDWGADVRIKLTQADGKSSGEKTQSEFKKSLVQKLKDKRAALRSKMPSPERSWST